MRHKLLLLTIFAFSTMTLLAIASWVSSKAPVQAAASDPAKLFVIVQNSAGTRITNATVTLTIGPVISPQWCNYAGKNGTWTATKVLWNGLTEYWFYQSSGVVLQICCNASSFSVKVSAPGYTTRTVPVSLAGYNGSYKDQYITLSPVPVNKLNVNSSPVTGASITGSQAGTTGTTNYTITKTGEDVATTLTANATLGSTRVFSSWTGCTTVLSGRRCQIRVAGGTTKTVTANYVGLPDLVIRNASGGTSPTITGPITVPAGQSATYTARTRNVGASSAGASTTKAWATGNTTTANFSVPALAVNTNSGVHTFTTSWSTPGNYTVYFKADNGGVVTESSDGNNTSPLSVRVTGGPDLVIRNETGGDTPAITGPTTLSVGQSGTFTAVTKNIGEDPAAAATTRASTTGSSNDSTDFPVGPLDAGKTSSVHSFTTSWNTPGSHTVTFKADNAGVLVTESTKGNNTASITVTIPEPPPEVCKVSATPTQINHENRTTTITAEGLDANKQYRFILSSTQGTVYVSEIKTADATGKVTYVQSYQYVDGTGKAQNLPEGSYKIEYYPLADPDKKCSTEITVFEIIEVVNPPDPVIPTPFGPVCGTAVCLAEAFLNTGLGVVGGVAFLLMVLGSYRLVFAGGNPDSVKSGREIVTAAIAGLVVVVFTIFILNLIGIGILGINII